MKKIILYLSVTFVFANCASVSTLQTARVLEEGDSFHAIGMGFYSSDDFIGGSDISLPLIEYAYRRGIWKDLDFGVKIAIIGTANVDVKYNLINGEKFALATGLGLGYLSFESESNGETAESSIIDLMIPLYASYDVSKMTSLYGATKYMLRTVSSDASSSADGSLLSNTLGIKIGEKAGVFMEGSLITGLDNDFSGTQFNGAYFFRF
jgi:hypothetical protein